MKIYIVIEDPFTTSIPKGAFSTEEKARECASKNIDWKIVEFEMDKDYS